MDRGYTLPDVLPGESNRDWCRRAAESIPAEALMRQLVSYFDRRARKSKVPTWSHLHDFFGHGSGVSAAIADRFRKGGLDAGQR